MYWSFDSNQLLYSDLGSNFLNNTWYVEPRILALWKFFLWHDPTKLINWFYQYCSDCITTYLFQNPGGYNSYWFGIINECRLCHNARSSQGVCLFFGILPTYKPIRYVEHVFVTYQKHYIAPVSGNIYVLNGYVLRNYAKIWSTICKSAIIK